MNRSRSENFSERIRDFWLEIDQVGSDSGSENEKNYPRSDIENRKSRRMYKKSRRLESTRASEFAD